MTANRYEATVRRTFYEIEMARLEREAWVGIASEPYSYRTPDFFTIAYHALFDDSLSRIIRVLDRNPKSATFWRLRKQKKRKIESYAKANAIDLGEIEDLADKLKIIRDKVHFHIDWQEVPNFQKPFRDANISEQVFDRVLDNLSSILSYLYKENGADPSVGKFSSKEAEEIVRTAKARGLVPK